MTFVSFKDQNWMFTIGTEEVLTHSYVLDDKF